jgi:hypothetical protein
LRVRSILSSHFRLLFLTPYRTKSAIFESYLLSLLLFLEAECYSYARGEVDASPVLLSGITVSCRSSVQDSSHATIRILLSKKLKQKLIRALISALCREPKKLQDQKSALFTFHLVPVPEKHRGCTIGIIHSTPPAAILLWLSGVGRHYERMNFNIRLAYSVANLLPVYIACCRKIEVKGLHAQKTNVARRVANWTSYWSQIYYLIIRR